MPAAIELQSPEVTVSEGRPVLGPGGNRLRVSETPPERKKEGPKKPKPKAKPKPQQPGRSASQVPRTAVRNNGSVDSSCSSGSCSSESSAKTVGSRGRSRRVGLKSLKIVPHGAGISSQSAVASGPPKRCDWITPNSDPLYTSFHDEEWGVPVHDDKKLFELLVLSQALAELSWPAILHKRAVFRKLFDDFDPASVARFTEKKLASLYGNGSLLSETKLRAVVENAKQMLKVQQGFGSFSNYCWGFVNHKPVRNGFRYTRQIPAKTPKAEVISKDLLQRGFRCVGPTVIYSFMQAAGMVNDHVATCFRFQECDTDAIKEAKARTEEQMQELTKALDDTSLPQV